MHWLQQEHALHSSAPVCFQRPTCGAGAATGRTPSCASPNSATSTTSSTATPCRRRPHRHQHLRLTPSTTCPTPCHPSVHFSAHQRGGFPRFGQEFIGLASNSLPKGGGLLAPDLAAFLLRSPWQGGQKAQEKILFCYLQLRGGVEALICDVWDLFSFRVAWAGAKGHHQAIGAVDR